MKTIDKNMAPVMTMKDGTTVVGRWAWTKPPVFKAEWEADHILASDESFWDHIFVYVKDIGDVKIRVDTDDLYALMPGDMVYAFIKLDKP